MVASLPRISVIIPSFNYADRIEAAIRSVIAQSETRWECIIVDDGSQDNSCEIIQRVIQGDNRFMLITHADGKNHGLAASLQLALSFCRAPLLAFLEADDSWAPSSLAERMHVMDTHPKAALCCNIPEIVVEDGADGAFQMYVGQVLQYLAKRGGKPAKMPLLTILALNPLCTFSCVMVRRDLFTACSFDTPVAPILDKWLWQQMSLMGECLVVNSTLTRWHIHKSSYIARRKDSELARNTLFVQETRKLLLPDAKGKYGLGVFCLLTFYGPATFIVRIITKFRVAGVKAGLRAVKQACQRFFLRQS